MARSVDNRVVQMNFDNKQFEHNIAQTMASLDKLKEKLNFDGAGKGLASAQAAANNFHLSGMHSALDAISGKFSAMGAVGFSVLDRLTNSAIDAGKSILGVITGPIVEGGKTRALALEHAEFMFEGLGLDVAAGMEVANKAVQGTSYSLASAANAAAQFGAAGMAIGPEMEGALRGIAGTAAMSGSTFEEVSSIFTQAAARGKISGETLMRLSDKSINGTAILAESMGVSAESISKMASEGEISFEQFAKAMDGAFGEHAQSANKTYEGSLANIRSAFARIGALFATPYFKLMRDIFNSLTPVINKVKDALKPLADVFTGWTQQVSFYFGLMTQSWEGGWLSAIPLLVDGIIRVFFSLLHIIEPIKQAFSDVFPRDGAGVIYKIISAFNELTKKFEVGTEGAETLRSIFKGIFSVFSIGWAIISEITGVFFNLFGIIAGGLVSLGGGKEGKGGVLDFFAKMGEKIFALKTLLVDGGGISKFFETLSTTLGEKLTSIMELIAKFKDKIGELFSAGMDSEPIKKAAESLGSLGDAIKSLFGGGAESAESGAKTSGSAITGVWQGIIDFGSKVIGIIKSVGEVIGKLLSSVSGGFSGFGDALSGGFSSDRVLKLLGGGALAGGIYGIIKLIKKLKDNPVTGFMGKLNEGFNSIKDTLAAIQLEIKSRALLNIAFAIGIFAVSLLLLASIDHDRMADGLSAITIGFGEMVLVMKELQKLGGEDDKLTDTASIFALSLGLVALGAALLIFAIAAKVIATMDVDELAKAGIGITGFMGAIVLMFKNLPSDQEILDAGKAIFLISAALVILGGAMWIYALMPLDKLDKALYGVGISLAEFVIAINALNTKDKALIDAAKSMVIMAFALIVLGVALKIIASIDTGKMAWAMGAVSVALGEFVLAINTMSGSGQGIKDAAIGILLLSGALFIMSLVIKQFEDMALGDIAIGLGAIAALLIEIVLAVNLTNGVDLAASAFGIIAIGAALYIMAQAVAVLAKLDVMTMIISVAALTIMMGSIVSAANSMTFAIAGALAMLVVAAAIWVIAKAVEVLAKLPIIALILIAVVIIIFAAAIVVLAAAAIMFAEPLALAGAALLAFGWGLFWVGAGAFLFGAAILLIAAAVWLITDAFISVSKVSKQGTENIVNFIIEVGKTLPQLASYLAQAIILFLNMLIAAAPDMLYQLGMLASMFLDMVNGLIPKINETIGQMIQQFSIVVQEQGPGLIDTGFMIVNKLLDGLDQNMEGITNKAVDILLKFMEALDLRIPELAAKGAEMTVHVIQGIDNNIDPIIAAGTSLIIHLVQGISDNMGKIVEVVGTAIIWFMIECYAQLDKITETGKDLFISFIYGMVSDILAITNAIGFAFFWLLWGIDQAVIKWTPQITEQGKNIAIHLLTGIAKGLIGEDNFIAIKNSITTLTQKMKDAMGVLWIWGSPSKVTTEYGGWIAQGFGVGIAKDKTAAKSAYEFGDSLRSTLMGAVSNLSSDLEGMSEFNPTITPVLDLSNVQNGSRLISGLMGTSSIGAGLSLDKASAIAYADSQQGLSDQGKAYGSQEIKFEQTINAPTQLNEAEIYRQTRSQISIAQKELRSP